MTDGRHRRPPRLAERLLSLILPSGIVGESILGDAREEYLEHIDSGSRVPSGLWYLGRACGIARRYAFCRSSSADERVVLPPSSSASRLGQAAEGLTRDLRFGLRSLRRRPTFAAISIVTLGLGIGATTAIFSVVDGVLLRDLPYEHPDEIVSIWKAWPSRQGVEGLDNSWDHIFFPWADYQGLRTHATTLSDVAAFMTAELVLTGSGEPEQISVGRASANLFDFLGVRPVLGRVFLEEEVPPIAEVQGARVAILSLAFWKGRFGMDPEIIGRSIVLRGTTYEVIGVLPEGFRVASDMIRTHWNSGEVDTGQRDVWIPLRSYQGTSHAYEILGRLEDGVGVEMARAEVQSLLTVGPEDQLALVEARKGFVTKGFGYPLLLLFGAAGTLLLVACVNVAGLLVGEATGRYHEVSVRYALGAGRGRIARQLLTENVLLGLMGTALGVFMAWIGTAALLSVAPPLPRLEEVGLSGRVLFFATLAGMGTGLMFGLAPSVALLAPNVGMALRGRAQSSGRGGRSLQAGVVSIQVALTVILLVAGGLFARSLQRLISVDPGFDAAGLVSLEVFIPDENVRTPEAIQVQARQRERLFQDVVNSTESVPGVSAVSGSEYIPFGGGAWTTGGIQLERQGETADVVSYIRYVLPNYHEVMGIPLRSGRPLTRADGLGEPRVMLVSESFAELHWPGESPVGYTVRLEGDPIRVVGVVGDVRKEALSTPAEPTIFLSAVQTPPRSLFLIAKTEDDPATMIPVLREAMRSVDPSILISSPAVLSSLGMETESDDFFRAVLMLTFAALATLLAAVGIFGVTSRSVAARAQEMGIRMALGARGAGLISLVLRESLLSAAIGAAAGLVIAFGAARLVEHFLFGVSSSDPATYMGVAAVLVAVFLGSAWLPAARVTRIAPMEVIAEE